MASSGQSVTVNLEEDLRIALSRFGLDHAETELRLRGETIIRTTFPVSPVQRIFYGCGWIGIGEHRYAHSV